MPATRDGWAAWKTIETVGVNPRGFDWSSALSVADQYGLRGSVAVELLSEAVAGGLVGLAKLTPPEET